MNPQFKLDLSDARCANQDGFVEVLAEVQLPDRRAALPHIVQTPRGPQMQQTSAVAYATCFGFVVYRVRSAAYCSLSLFRAGDRSSSGGRI